METSGQVVLNPGSLTSDPDISGLHPAPGEAAKSIP